MYQPTQFGAARLSKRPCSSSPCPSADPRDTGPALQPHPPHLHPCSGWQLCQTDPLNRHCPGAQKRVQDCWGKEGAARSALGKPRCPESLWENNRQAPKPTLEPLSTVRGFRLNLHPVAMSIFGRQSQPPRRAEWGRKPGAAYLGGFVRNVYTPEAFKQRKTYKPIIYVYYR